MEKESNVTGSNFYETLFIFGSTASLIKWSAFQISVERTVVKEYNFRLCLLKNYFLLTQKLHILHDLHYLCNVTEL